MPEKEGNKKESEPRTVKRKRVPILTKGIGTRISEACDAIGSKRLAAQQAGISEDMVYRYIREDANPAVEVVAALAGAAGMSVQWLVTGHLSYSENSDRDRNGKTTKDSADQVFAQIPRYDVEAAAGSGRAVDDEAILGYYAFRRDWLYAKDWRAEDLGIVVAKGDSQEGLIDDGQPVLVHLADCDITQGGLFVLRLDEHLVIKIAQIDHRGSLILSSSNALYRDIIVPKSEIGDVRIIGRAVWTDRLL